MKDFNVNEHLKSTLDLNEATEVVDQWADGLFAHTVAKSANASYDEKSEIWAKHWDIFEGPNSNIYSGRVGPIGMDVDTPAYGGLVREERERIARLRTPDSEDLELLTSNDREDVIAGVEAKHAADFIDKDLTSTETQDLIIEAFERVERFIATATHRQCFLLYRKVANRLGTMHRKVNGKTLAKQTGYYAALCPTSDPATRRLAVSKFSELKWEAREANKPTCYQGEYCKAGEEVSRFLPWDWLVALTHVIHARIQQVQPNAAKGQCKPWRFTKQEVAECGKRMRRFREQCTPPERNAKSLRLNKQLPPERRHQAYIHRLKEAGRVPAIPRKHASGKRNPHWMQLALGK